MTDQVPNFTLPSQTLQKSKPALPAILLKTTLRLAPPIALIAAAIYLISVQIRRARSRQISSFQSQLASLSTMLDLDLDPAQSSDSPTAASTLNQSRFRFRTETPATAPAATNVQLDLFSDAKPAPAGKEKKKSSKSTALPTVQPASDFERAVLTALSDPGSAKATLLAVQKEAGLSDAEAAAVYTTLLSKQASLYVDGAVPILESDEKEVLRLLGALSGLLGATRAARPEAQLRYAGGADGAAKEGVYQRYALFCLSGPESGAPDLDGLEQVQAFLGVDAGAAERINTELAKGMFQVAVSAAMADGSLDGESRAALDALRGTFSGMLDGDSADNIMSEVAVMRAMYSLQQLLAEQGVSEDDVKELRKMCKELGVDIDDMLQNADALGDALGPEAKEFVQSLQGLLAGGGEEGKGKPKPTTADT